MRAGSKARRPGGGLGSGRCYGVTAFATVVIGLLIFYYYLFIGLRKYREVNPESAPAAVVDKLEAATSRLKRYLAAKDGNPPTAAAAAAAVGFSVGGAAATAAAGGVGAAAAHAPLPGAPLAVQPPAEDPDAYLDVVNEREHFPKIVPSHYAQVTGIEPFERSDLKPWDLHAYPSDDWYERAKKATDRCDLELTQQWAGAQKGLDDKVVWVTGLFDLKRGESGNKEFQRGMDEYFARFQRVIDCGFEMVIYMPLQFKSHLRLDEKKHLVIDMNATDLHTYFPYYDRLTAVRTSKLWVQQGEIAGWLINSPQARLAEYNPLVMSKLIMLQQAARLNPFGSRYHLWVDAGHLCAGGQRPEATSLMRRHMSRAFLITHWPYATDTEVHGFTDKAMHIYMAQAEEPLQIVRGGVFGGQLPWIECVLKAYIIALHQTLSDGYAGTEECIWAIIFKRLPHLFAPFDNNSLGSHGDNCAVFTANNMEEEAIKAGTKTKFVSPPVPKFPSWWDEAQAAGGRGAGAASGKAPGGRAANKAVAGLLRVGGISTGAGSRALRG